MLQFPVVVIPIMPGCNSCQGDISPYGFMLLHSGHSIITESAAIIPQCLYKTLNSLLWKKQSLALKVPYIVSGK